MRFRSGVRAVSRRKRLTGAHPTRPSNDRQGLKVAAAVVVPLLVAVALIAAMAANDDGEGSSTAASTTTTVTANPEAQAFQGKVDEAFKPLGDAIKIFLPKAQEFEAGKVTPADFKGAVEVALPEFVKSRDAVAALEPYKPEPAINAYFLDAAELYVETARVYGVAVDPVADGLRGQLNIAAKRLRTLGDRIYDRGRTVLDPGFYAPSSAEVEIRPPTEVPDWVAEGMAAGPPLAETPGPPAPTPPVRQPTCGDGDPGKVRVTGDGQKVRFDVPREGVASRSLKVTVDAKTPPTRKLGKSGDDTPKAKEYYVDKAGGVIVLGAPLPNGHDLVVDGLCRIEESVKDWVSKVKQAGSPQPPEVVRAIDALDGARLGQLASKYEAVTRALRMGPDPKEQRERAAVTGLGLLLDGEAARLGQVAALLPGGEPRARLMAVARRSLVVGDDILEPDLGFQRSGLPRSLLSENGL